MRHILGLLIPLLLCCAAYCAEPNGIETPGFTPPVLIPLSDASIVVGNAVWNSTDGKVYVVNAKNSSNATLVLAESPGFVSAPVFSVATKVQKLDRLVITIPPVPTATASAP